MKQGDVLPRKFAGRVSSWPYGHTYIHIYNPMALQGKAIGPIDYVNVVFPPKTFLKMCFFGEIKVTL